MKTIRFVAPFSAFALAALVACGSEDAGSQGAEKSGGSDDGNITFGNGSTIGDGNATKEVIDALAEAAAAGVAVVRSSRVGSGIVRRNIEVDDDRLGFAVAYELNPQKARVLLRLALLETRTPAEIQRIFAEY